MRVKPVMFALARPLFLALRWCASPEARCKRASSGYQSLGCGLTAEGLPDVLKAGHATVLHRRLSKDHGH